MSHAISIHAPPRGATKNKNAFLGGIDISIHAPPRGATLGKVLLARFRLHFNSRPSARGDRGDGGHFRNRQDFNSRPSARGDDALEQAKEAGYISIHAPPRGATEALLLAVKYEMISIHAPPRGATPVSRVQSANTSNFNSRPSARGDPKFREAYIRAFISIHAPPRGATRAAWDAYKGIMISIHAPPRGATLIFRSMM